MSRIRKLASETAIYGLSSIVGRMINFLLFPFYSHVFPPAAYSVVGVVYAAFVFLNILYQYGMESAYLKYAAARPEDRPAVFSTATWSLLGSSVGLSLLMLALQQPVGGLIGLADTWPVLGYAALILVLDTLGVVPLAELRLQNRAWTFASIRLVNIGVNVGLNLVLILVFGWGVEAVFVANIAASAATLLQLAPAYRRSLRWAFDRALWHRMLAFGLPFVPGGLGYAVTDRINLFFLAQMDAGTVVQLYGAGHDASYVVGVFSGVVKLAIFLALFVQMFRFAWQPFFLQHAEDADAPHLFSRTFTLLTAAMLLVLLGISFFLRELVAFPLPGGRMLIAEVYWPGLSIVPVAMLGYLFQGWYYHVSAGAYIKKQTRYFIHATLVGSVVALGLNTLLVPRFGMLGAAWATAAAYGAMTLTLLFVVQRFYHVPYAWGRVAVMVVLAGGLFGAWQALPTLQVWWAEGLLLAAFGGGLLLFRLVSAHSLVALWPARTR
jgi:O-antigen/teichoic acid export membrane protein